MAERDLTAEDTAGMGGEGVRAQLSATIVSAAGPYGYTISLGGSTAMTAGELGSPDLGAALLLMLGAVIGFVVLEVMAHGTLAPRTTAPDRPPSIWGNAHVPAVSAALVLVWCLLQLVDGVAVWAAVGFVVTTVYFMGTVLQRIAVRQISQRLGRRG